MNNCKESTAKNSLEKLLLDNCVNLSTKVSPSFSEETHFHFEVSKFPKISEMDGIDGKYPADQPD